jgi:hypothetical protein
VSFLRLQRERVRLTDDSEAVATSAEDDRRVTWWDLVLKGKAQYQ